MNSISRVVTGLIIIVFSLSYIIFLGFFSGRGIDYSSIVIGFFFLIIGFLILFNKREDEIERIKKRK